MLQEHTKNRHTGRPAQGPARQVSGFSAGERLGLNSSAGGLSRAARLQATPDIGMAIAPGAR